jgi:hypothetical protein
LPAGGGQATDGVIAAGGQVTVPAGKTLYVTDLVFTNSSNTATGPLGLNRGTTTVLNLQLENFRNLDFHFVTPIVVSAGQQLSLQCGSGSTDCSGTTASIYFSGYER